ncbi:Ferrous iron transport protein B [Phocoenobacter uteri]|uniref:Ferrous iron transport protein B n=1 Tax=Phocoenobacter uteri TaxID=146806 RepID=A0A379CB00_9PAST|nr:ferrous iron transport protein B [Phocoenobacter uteri]MDG6882710.1 ferrous iron transporter B [Phocoenobacter uteri]SUB58876.1 Ferrous iron transport protein B [Phocoenobacter uteri]
MKIALVGNPNSGKTTLFNGITGKLEKVGNWAGVTIAKKEAFIKPDLATKGTILAVDLPGAYSMSPYTSEESITSDFVKNENPDVIVNIVDATNLSRSLFFTVQLLELGIPVVMALNKTDLNLKQKNTVNVKALAEKLGVSIVETIATDSNKNGFQALINAVYASQGKAQQAVVDVGTVDVENAESMKEADIKRYAFVKKLVADVSVKQTLSNQKNTQDKVDLVVANKWLGLPIFAVIMYLVFSISQEHVGPYFADLLVGWLEEGQGIIGDMLSTGVSEFWSALLVDGIIGGVIAVVGFLPLIMVLFFLLALLEDSGYMARVAVVMDRFFKIVGLSGKSIIPMVISTGCAIPGIMSTRTIKDVRQRRTTAMLTSFLPCGAKLPVIALFAGVFFKDAAWVGWLMYFVGILIIFFGAYLVMLITGSKNKKTYFIMELPAYKFPSLKRALISMLSRAKAFIIKAGTVILVCNAVVQIMQTFNWQFQTVSEEMANTSILAGISSPFAFVLIPLGFGVWQLAAAAITGFIAKENVVGTLAVVYGVTNFINTDELALVGGASNVAEVMGLTSSAALAYLMFNLFTPPCFAAIGAMNSEMENKKWLWAGIGLQFSVGYIIAYFVYQIGTFITTGNVGRGVVQGGIVSLCLISLVVYLVRKGNSKSIK